RLVPTTLNAGAQAEIIGVAVTGAGPTEERPESLDRLGIDRRAGGASDHQWRTAEEELVDAVGGTIFGELPQVEHLAHGELHGRDPHAVPRLVRLHGLIGTHLDTPGVGADGGDLLFLAPVAVLELDPRSVAAREGAPALREAFLQLPGADDHEIAAADRDAVCACARVKLGVRYAVAVRQVLHVLETRDIKQYAAPDHLVARMFDAKLAEAVAIDQPGVVAVVHPFLVEDMAERVPMGRALHRHVDGVIGVADIWDHVLAARHRVGACRQHGVDRVPAAAEQAGL